MDGKHSYDPDEYPSEEFRTWRLCTMLHCTPSQLEQESAIALDWLLQVDDTVAQFKHDKQQEAMRRNG